MCYTELPADVRSYYHLDYHGTSHSLTHHKCARLPFAWRLAALTPDGTSWLQVLRARRQHWHGGHREQHTVTPHTAAWLAWRAVSVSSRPRPQNGRPPCPSSHPCDRVNSDSRYTDNHNRAAASPHDLPNNAPGLARYNDYTSHTGGTANPRFCTATTLRAPDKTESAHAACHCAGGAPE